MQRRVLRIRGAVLAGLLAVALAASAGQAGAAAVSIIPLLGQSPQLQLRDSRICEVWASRKAGAASASGAGDVLTGLAVGYAAGWFLGSTSPAVYFGAGLFPPSGAALAGAGIGATAGALLAMNKQIVRTRVYGECMSARGYQVS